MQKDFQNEYNPSRQVQSNHKSKVYSSDANVNEMSRETTQKPHSHRKNQTSI